MRWEDECSKDMPFKIKNQIHLLRPFSVYRSCRRQLKFLCQQTSGSTIPILSVAATANSALLNVSFKREKFVGADVFQSNLVSLLREINQKFDNFAFVIDEAQVLAFIKGMDSCMILRQGGI